MCLVLAQDSGRCSECVFRGFKCDVEGIPVSDWSSLEKEERRIRSEKKETLAKLLRLERQEEFLRSRGLAMLRRGLHTLDELEAAEEKEKEKAKLEAERQGQQPPTPSASEPGSSGGDPSVDLLAGVDFSDPFWATLGFGGGTPRASQSNS